MDTRWRSQTLGEEIANAVTHGIGAALSIAGFLYLGAWALLYGDGWRIAGVAVYGVTLVALYLASTVYHAISAEQAKAWARTVDRSAIFVFIAGCYTPFTLIPLRGGFGWGLLATIWALAIVGVALEVVLKARFMVWSTVFYLAMGWLALVAAGPMIELMEPRGLLWMVAGGLSYSGGLVFFWWTRLPFHHAIWHLFVLGGSACHFQAISGYVLPMPG
jgi:hemolysin III